MRGVSKPRKTLVARSERAGSRKILNLKRIRLVQGLHCVLATIRLLAFSTSSVHLIRVTNSWEPTHPMRIAFVLFSRQLQGHANRLD